MALCSSSQAGQRVALLAFAGPGPGVDALIALAIEDGEVLMAGFAEVGAKPV